MNIEYYLKSYREKRGFNVENYLEKKIIAINDFFSKNNLDSAVIGISGGVDSALVLYLLKRASEEHNSPIRQIMPISIPIRNVSGVTSQNKASFYADLVMESAGYTYYEVPLEEAYNSIIKSSCDIHANENDAWVKGQMASVLRTPVLYFHAAILQGSGYKSIVVGTTNRDEGAYIGFFGKASDAMVDLQPIADLHKSEVYQLAKHLGVPERIINRKPQGDVWDRRNDEEMIGASYDMIELFLLMEDIEPFQDFFLIDENERNLFDNSFNAIMELHYINKHKYEVGNPAHFIDVMQRTVKGGWK